MRDASNHSGRFKSETRCPDGASRGLLSASSSCGQDVFTDLSGFIDIHVHSAPSIFARSVDDEELALEAEALKMRGFVLKAHEESTASRAQLLRERHSNLDIFGCIVLNWFVGGINPYATELAIYQGAKIVWMPTGSAQQHIDYYGGSDYSAQPAKRKLRPQPGIRIIDEDGNVIPALYDVLDLVAEHDVVAASGHLSPEETVVFVKLAKERGIRKILVAHPDLGINKMTLELQRELVKHGAVVEKSYLPLMPSWRSVEMDEFIHSIRVLGPENCVLQTDFGQANHVTPARGYLEFVNCLVNNGISVADIRMMGCENPANLLDLPFKS
ncbi:hypothetical protein JI721_06950 [Alicyclobacillus cycloheptanicus]|uniref:Amidohydrolase-related domain-containing protein n=1 Tax=Alicyclobacillus cycloheptanicus TaxID=1457 RepID=A0ABT9XHL4_9BACL|nr:DUF6282 family protein [Alicyclobacillus cycloheptanicus]MDQ0189805.1 hypothetical protein [Alicyclobacillus cycloheptanicus]WDM02504.1 hypothetical protein JI721_06950 [Alicyclobacillus cycloheptanicus]